MWVHSELPLWILNTVREENLRIALLKQSDIFASFCEYREVNKSD